MGGGSCKPISLLPNSPVRAWRLGMVGWGLGGSCYHNLARLCTSSNSIPTVHRATMYLREACSLLPFWALLWPKKPLSENTFEYRCSLMITEMECNLFFISIASAVIPHGIKSPGTSQHYKLIPKGNLNKHCLSLIEVVSWAFSLWCLQPAVAENLNLLA